MKFFDYIRFALKNIWRQKLRTLLTIFAVIIGATSVVAMLSLVFGAKAAILGQIEASGALTQVTVTSSTDTSDQDIFGGGNQQGEKKLDDTLVAQLAAMSHVSSVTPQISAYSFQKVSLKGGDGKEYSLNNVIGYKPSADADKRLTAGRNIAPTDTTGKIVLDGSLATKLGFEKNPGDLVGKTVLLTMQKGYQGAGADIPLPPEQPIINGPMTKAQQDEMQKQQEEYRNELNSKITKLEAEVVGVAEAGFSNSSYISLEWARGVNTWQNWQQDPTDMERYNKEREQLARTTPPGVTPKLPSPVKMILVSQDQTSQSGYGTLAVKIDSADNVESVATEVRKLGVGAITAKDMLETILNSFKIISVVLGLVGAISLLVAAIGVVNTMVMATLERTREIGVMRATGATRAAVRRLFTFEAALLGFWGGVFGVLAGIGLGKIANHYAADFLQGVGTTNLIQVPVWLGAAVIGVTTIIGMLAGMYPAFRAARMNPVEALRYE